MNNFTLYVFSKKTGKVLKTIHGKSAAMLKLWALNGNLKATQGCFLSCDENGCISFLAIGKKDDFPKIKEFKEGEKKLLDFIQEQ